MTQDGHGGCHASLGRGGEGRTDHQAVGKVMKAVSNNYHHRQQGNPLSWEHKGMPVLLEPLGGLGHGGPLIKKSPSFMCVCTVLFKEGWLWEMSHSDGEDSSCP